MPVPFLSRREAASSSVLRPAGRLCVPRRIGLPLRRTMPDVRRPFRVRGRRQGGRSPGWDYLPRTSPCEATLGGHLPATTKDADIRRWSLRRSGLCRPSATGEASPLALQGILAFLRVSRSRLPRGGGVHTAG